MFVWGFLRNIPQIVIQCLYIADTKSIDIFVISAMLFSVVSVIFNLFYEISRQLKHRYKSSTQSLCSESQRIYKIKILCEEIKSYHKYTHKLLAKLLCSVLGIDDSGNIQVFYIVGIRHGIIAHVEICTTNLDDDHDATTTIEKTKTTGTTDCCPDKRQIFTRFERIGKKGDKLNEALKQELNNALQLNLVDDEENSNEPGQDRNSNLISIGDKMQICICVSTENDSFPCVFAGGTGSAGSHDVAIESMVPIGTSLYSVKSRSASNAYASKDSGKENLDMVPKELHSQAYTSGGPVSPVSAVGGVPIASSQSVQGLQQMYMGANQVNQHQMQQMQLQVQMLQAQVQYLQSQQSQERDQEQGVNQGEQGPGEGEGNYFD